MTTQLTHSLTIIIPKSRLRPDANYPGYSTELHQAIYAATRAAGGRSLNREARSEWFDNQGNLHSDTVREYTWWYDPKGDFNEASWVIASLLLRQGAQSVMTIKTSPDTGTRAHMIY